MDSSSLLAWAIACAFANILRSAAFCFLHVTINAELQPRSFRRMIRCKCHAFAAVYEINAGIGNPPSSLSPTPASLPFTLPPPSSLFTPPLPALSIHTLSCFIILLSPSYHLFITFPLLLSPLYHPFVTFSPLSPFYHLLITFLSLFYHLFVTFSPFDHLLITFITFLSPSYDDLDIASMWLSLWYDELRYDL